MDPRGLNFKYALVNIGFLLLVAGTMGYAYNFLSQSGFSDGTIGTIMTLISLLGVLAGPAAGDLVDRSERITQKMFITASMVACAAGAAVLLLLPAASPAIIPTVVVAFVCASIGMPLLNGMAFIYERAGGVINYGLCRGLGSAAYAVGSTIVGRLWAQLGTSTLPIWAIAGAAFTCLAVNLMPDAPKELAVERREKDEDDISVLQFFGTYRGVTLVAVALVLMYFCHFIINTFMAKVIGMFQTENVEEVQGNALFIAAMLELPMMFGFSLVLRRMSVERILVVSSVIYSIKHLLTFAAVSVPMFYAAMALQMFSYAALVPATVYFANEHVDEKDRNKGQAILTAAASVGGLLASFVAGWLFDFVPVRTVLGLGAFASVCGTVLMVFALRQISAKRI